MKRRKLILTLGASAAGGSVLLGSGAFTSVAADRDVAVDVADDSDAFLQIQPATDKDGNELPNGQYAREVNGILELNFTEENDRIEGGGEGFNLDAETSMTKVFEIANQGTQLVELVVSPPEQPDTGVNGIVLSPDIELPGEFEILLVITPHYPAGTLDDPDDPTQPIPLKPGEKQVYSVTACVREDLETDEAVETDTIIISAEAI